MITLIEFFLRKKRKEKNTAHRTNSDHYPKEVMLKLEIILLLWALSEKSNKYFKQILLPLIRIENRNEGLCCPYFHQEDACLNVSLLINPKNVMGKFSYIRPIIFLSICQHFLNLKCLVNWMTKKSLKVFLMRGNKITEI